jgi:hypothetical protein
VLAVAGTRTGSEAWGETCYDPLLRQRILDEREASPKTGPGMNLGAFASAAPAVGSVQEALADPADQADAEAQKGHEPFGRSVCDSEPANLVGRLQRDPLGM